LSCRREDRFCETKPIWPKDRGSGIGGQQRALRTRPRPFCAKRTQFPAEEKRWQVLYGKMVMAILTRHSDRKNEPNFGGRAGFGDGRRGGCTNKPNRPERIVRNKPNWQGVEMAANYRYEQELGKDYAAGTREKTKPIARSGAPRRCLDCGLGTGLWPNARPAAWRLRPARAGCTNEPNFRRARYPIIPLFHRSNIPGPASILHYPDGSGIFRPSRRPAVPARTVSRVESQ
jgi:hypothetical protein